MCEGAVGPAPVLYKTSKNIEPGALPYGTRHDDMLESVLPMEKVSSGDVANSSSSMKFSAHTTDRLSSNDTSEVGESMSCRRNDRRAPVAPMGV